MEFANNKETGNVNVVPDHTTKAQRQRQSSCHSQTQRYMQLHMPAASMRPKEQTPGTHPTGAWVGPRSSLDVLEDRKTFCPCQESNPGSSSP